MSSKNHNYIVDMWQIIGHVSSWIVRSEQVVQNINLIVVSLKYLYEVVTEYIFYIVITFGLYYLFKKNAHRLSCTNVSLNSFEILV